MAEVDIMNSGLLVFRVGLGLLLAAHGSQKLFGWFGGYGLKGTGGFFESLGFRPGRLFAGLAGATELFSGVLVALGLLGPIGPALVVSVMVVAAVGVHWQHGLFAASNGIEMPLLYGIGAAALALTGPGAYSGDAIIGTASIWTPDLNWIALVAGLIGGALNLSLRRPARATVVAH
jgi:putative oxidoreductase